MGIVSLGSPEVGNKLNIVTYFTAPALPESEQTLQSTAVTFDWIRPDGLLEVQTDVDAEVTGPTYDTTVVDGVTLTRTRWIWRTPTLTQQGKYAIRSTSTAGITASHQCYVDVPAYAPFDTALPAPPAVAGSFPAAQISLTDTGGYFATDTAEAALQQLGARAILGDTAGLTIGIGDSVMLGNDDQVNNTQNQSWFAELCRQSGQKMRYYRNAGVAGNTSTQMLARIATDVTAYAPSWAIIAGITANDVATPVATVKANIAAMVDACQDAGIRVMVASGTPSDTAGTRAFLVAMNAWLEPWANARGLPFLDLYSYLADPADGTYLAAFTADGTHPNVLAVRGLAATLLTSLPPVFIRGPFLTAGLNDAGNLVTNGVFVGDANVDGFADNWATLGGSLTLKQLVAMSASEGYGNWQELTCNGGIGGIDCTALTGWSVGDTLEISCKVKAVNATAVTFGLRRNSSSLYHNLANGVDFNGSAIRVLYGRMAIPASTTTLVVRCQVNSVAGAVSFGQVTVRNLTTLAVL
jgi:lysophospholipase L1-like esterase